MGNIGKDFGSTTMGGNDFGNAANELKNDLKADAKGLIDRTTERAHELKEAAMQRGKNAVSAVQTSVESRPLAYIAGAFAGGILLGMWLRRR
jgi:ElaB/YqjD/DUF883 family membrane-anchored ribosome-binding protein